MRFGGWPARVSAVVCIFAALIFVGARAAHAQQDMLLQNPTGKPEVLQNVGLDQRLNNQVPLDISFRDEHGVNVTIGQLLQNKPAILTLVYYQCPMLCTEVLNSTLNGLKEIPLNIGKDFDVITVSIDPTEKPILAEAKQTMYVGLYGRPGAVRGWHFLTGDKPQIDQLSASVGYRFVYDKASSQFAHASGIMVLTPEGRVSRYFYGISYAPRDLRLGLVEASEGRIGSPVDAILLYCFHYEASTGKYGVAILRVVRAAGILTVLLIALMVIFFMRREKHSIHAGSATRRAV